MVYVQRPLASGGDSGPQPFIVDNFTQDPPNKAHVRSADVFSAKCRWSKCILQEHSAVWDGVVAAVSVSAAELGG